MLVSEIHLAVLAYLPGWTYVTLVLTQDDRVGRKDGKVWVQFLRSRLSVGGAFVGASCYIRRESEAHQPYSQCCLQREGRLASAMIPPL